MKINKLLKKLEKDYELKSWLTLIPISVIIGSIGQITILSRYEAIIFFSWNQVFIDTAILFMLLISFFVGFWTKDFFFKLSPTWKEKFRGFMFINYSMFLFFIVLSLFKQVNYYFMALYFFFLFGYIASISYSIGNINKDKRIDEKYWIFFIPTIPLLLILLVFLILLSFFGVGYSYLYQNLEIKIDEEDYPVRYMNDKIIIYGEGQILANKGDHKFIIKNND